MEKELEKLIRSDLHRLGIKKMPSAFGHGLPLQAKYLILWRKAAFYYKKGGFLRKWYGWRLDKMQERTQITLPREVQAGSGLYIGHLGRLIVHPDVKMGSNINLSTGVTIGQANRGKRKGIPTFGNNVWIGTNAVITGNIRIGNDVMICPNAFVNMDVPDHSIVIGNPAVIHHRDNATESYINNRVDL